MIEAEQTEHGKTTRNDRLIAVAASSHNHGDVRTLDQIGDSLISEIEHFFISYNLIKGKKFVPLERVGVRRAKEVVSEGVKQFEEKHPSRME